MRTARRMIGRLALAALVVAGLGQGTTRAQDAAPRRLESIPARSANEIPLPGDMSLPNAKEKDLSVPDLVPLENAPPVGRTVVVEEGPLSVSAPATVVTPMPGRVVGAPAVWVPGRLVKDSDTMVWIEGRWVKPLVGAPRYVPGQYERRIGLLRWVPGHWQGGIAPSVVETRPAATEIITSEPGVVRVENSPSVGTPTGSVTVLKPVPETGTGTVTVTAPGAPVPATPHASGYWKQGLLGNYRWVPGRVSGY